jgi:tetratricopeptide (TPR) repeat protein
MRRSALIILAFLALPRLASAAADKEAPPPAKGAESALIETLRTAKDPSARAEAAKKLAALDPIPVDALVAHLKRKRSSTDKQRRRVLRKIHAEVPDHRGKFRTPGRRSKKQIERADKLDWLAKLLELSADTPGLSDAIVDVAIIRALAHGKAPGGYAILDFGFADGLIYRDECGRYLRNMRPYSIPALIEAAGQRRNYSLYRYATYQLERLDRQSSVKALNAAGGDADLEIAVLRAFGKVRYRDAVRVVWANVNHHVPTTRAAARKAWLRYVTGKPPKPAPKRFLKKTGGEKTKKKKKLWLNSRELARVLLEEDYEKTFGKDPRRSWSEETLTKKLFEHFDAERKKREEADFVAANQLVANGKYAEAATAFDRLLTTDAQHPRKAEMVPAFLGYARQLAADGKWRLAAAQFRKTALLAEGTKDGNKARAWYHYTLGRALADDGAKDESKEQLRKALAVDSSFAEAKAALAGRAPKAGEKPAAEKKGRSWMLYAGIGGGGIALLLLVIGLVIRRR